MINRPLSLVGLSSLEYEQAKQELLLNYDVKEKDRTVLSIIKKNVFTFFNLINIVIAVLLIFAQSYRNLLFLIVVVLNVLIGTVQEIRAKQIREKLSLLSKNKLKCIRDGMEILVNPADIALFDLLVLKRGDQIPADCEIEQGTVFVDESMITGESEKIFKTKGDSLLGGSFVTEGIIYVRVTAVSKDCYIKKLQMEVRKDIRPKSLLLEQVNSIIKFSTIVILPVGLLLFYKIFQATNQFHQTMPQVAAALIGMIPSGLVLLTSIALSIGVINLSKRNALVNELSAIENLARVDTLCLDKTGTITSGKMCLREVVYLHEDAQSVDDKIKIFLTHKAEENDTITAIRLGLNIKDHIEVENEHSVSFSSEKKWSSAFVDNIHYILGAPSFITKDLELVKQADNIATEGFRVLLFCQTREKITTQSDLSEVSVEYLSLIVLQDSIRTDIKDTISYFYRQDVNVKVISGDNANTVRTIAKQVGIQNADKAVDNQDISEQLNIEDYNVYGRVSPYNKQLIVRKLIDNGHTVAMTGDGINDLPAMKISNCSISMGSGNEATKNLSQIVLLNNNFSVMPSIVAEGRRIINNIGLSASLFLNKTLFSALLSILCAIFSLQYPFQPIQLTLISSLTIGLPSFLLTFEANKSRVKGNFLINVFKNSLPTGITVAVMAIIILAISDRYQIAHSEASTIISYLTTILLMASLLRICFPFNKYRLFVVGGVLISLINAIVFIKHIFYFVPLGDVSKIILLVASIIGLCKMFVLYIMIAKFFNKKLGYEKV